MVRFPIMNGVARSQDAFGAAGPVASISRPSLGRRTWKRPIAWVVIFGALLVGAASCQSFPALGLGPPAPEALLGPQARTMPVRFGVRQLLNPSTQSAASIPGASGVGAALLPAPPTPWIVETGGTILAHTLLFEYQDPANYVGLRYFPAYTTWEMFQVKGGVERRLHTWLISADDIGTLTIARTDTEVRVALGGYRTRISLPATGSTVDNGAAASSGSDSATQTFVGIAGRSTAPAPTDFFDLRF